MRKQSTASRFAERELHGFDEAGSEERIVVFKSNGLAAWDVAIGAVALELAGKKKVGRRI